MVADNVRDARLSVSRLKIDAGPLHPKRMCTVSFLPFGRGFYLGMNRDELLARAEARPPTIVDFNRTKALYPSEETGGTWIGINEFAVCFALINWYAVPTRPASEGVSRGVIIPNLLRCRSMAEASERLARIPLHEIAPFRLIGIGCAERALSEFRWDGEALEEIWSAWERRHWFSSGYDEARANLERELICRQAWTEPDAGRLSWLRRLHASHKPARGPFSICMHRPEAATVSYTEIRVSRACARMRYVPHAPCKERASGATNLPAHYENATLRLRPAGGEVLSGCISSRDAGRPHADRGDGTDEPHL